VPSRGTLYSTESESIIRSFRCTNNIHSHDVINRPTTESEPSKRPKVDNAMMRICTNVTSVRENV